MSNTTASWDNLPKKNKSLSSVASTASVSKIPPAVSASDTSSEITSISIVTNMGNPVALKPVIAAYMIDMEVDLEEIIVPLDGRQRPRLPLLIIDYKTKLFDSNEMISYMIEEYLGYSLRPSWLNFVNLEANTIAPLVMAYLLEKREEEDFNPAQELRDEILKLKSALGEKLFFGQGKENYTEEKLMVPMNPETSPGFEDAILWSTLYPLLALNSRDKLLKDISWLTLWFERCSLQEPFHKAKKLVKPLSGKEASKAILICNPSSTAASIIEGLARMNSTTAIKKPESIIQFEDAEEGDFTPPQPTTTNVSSEDIAAAKRSWHSFLPHISTKPKRSGQILPLVGENNYFITSALPYVNNVPHLGNIIGCVLSADVFARYCRVRGRNTLYICGTDEYGTATETKALEEKLTPQQICDKYHKLHKEIYDWFNISFDYFGRTTTKNQTEIGQSIFLKLNENGFLQEQDVEQVYCIPCKRFLSDRFVEGTCPVCNYEDARGDQCDKCGRLTNSIELKKPKCKVCGSNNVTTKISKQIFLDLPKLEEQVKLSIWLDESSEAWTSNARNIAKSWIREGLKERCITRDLNWGTPVPIEEYKNKVFYVWFDAPIGYISMTKSYTENWQLWWNNSNPEITIDYYQFMAKDNVPFHSILFPASLLGTREPWTLVSHLIATEYLNYEDGKFSKSRGVGVFGNDAIQTGIPADIWRFYLIFIRPENQDSAFSWDDFMTKNNSELLNNLGNFINRSLTFLARFFESKIPPINLKDVDYQIIAEINKEIIEYADCLDTCKFRDGLRQILAISKIGNVYFQSQQPWTLNKNEAEKERCGTICGLGAQIVFLLMTLLDPFMPAVSKQIREQLNVPNPIFSINLQQFLTPGHQIGKVVPLFVKLELDLINTLRKKYAGLQSARVETPKSPRKGQGNSSVNGADATPEEVGRIEADIAKQANLVRDLKAAKTEKSLLQPQIEKLLQLKAELIAKQTIIASTPLLSTEEEIVQIEAAITKQANLVRDLKSAKTEKSLLQPQIDKLLQLKSQLSAKQTKVSNSPLTLSPEEISNLEAEVAKQANVVRDLKAAKTDLSIIQSQVDKLLRLKAELAAKQGVPASANPGKKSKVGKSGSKKK